MRVLILAFSRFLYLAGIKFSYNFLENLLKSYCSFPLVLQTYSEPVEGKFEDATAAILERLRSDDEESGTDSDMDMEFEA